MTTPVDNTLGTQTKTFIAGGTVPANRFVKLDSTEGQVVVATAITDSVIGVSKNAASSGQPVSVQSYGIAKVVAGDTVTLGADVMPVASGTGEADDAAGVTALSCGKALMGGAVNALVEVLLQCPSVKTPANT